ncbi:hypothetical protein D3C71_2228710 [compost metagenome]
MRLGFPFSLAVFARLPYGDGRWFDDNQLYIYLRECAEIDPRIKFGHIRSIGDLCRDHQ